MKDIQTRQDIELLINEFYKRATTDEVIGRFFTQVVSLDWNTHIPVMYDFWESILLGGSSYKGNPMIKHVELDKKEKLQGKHFERWLLLWNETIENNFAGIKANEAKERASSIGSLMQFKVESGRT